MIILKDAKNISTNGGYRGRFAPSPTGPLHLGSLMAAAGSYLDAKMHGGEWLVRMEDIDRHREQPGAADSILSALERYGFEWDGEVVYQHERLERYQQALDDLIRADDVYPCVCSRKEIADSSIRGIDGPIYAGTCRNGLEAGKVARSWRLKVEHGLIEFEDRLQGDVRQNLATELGDFVLRRADGFFAYQLAVVVDDFDQGITDIVRGSDLLDSTPRQIFLQQRLGYFRPRYMHLPTLVNRNGEKLSKQTRAQPIPFDSDADCTRTLAIALSNLGLQVPNALLNGKVKPLWRWARQIFDPNLLPATRLIRVKE